MSEKQVKSLPADASATVANGKEHNNIEQGKDNQNLSTNTIEVPIPNEQGQMHESRSVLEAEKQENKEGQQDSDANERKFDKTSQSLLTNEFDQKHQERTAANSDGSIHSSQVLKNQDPKVQLQKKEQAQYQNRRQEQQSLEDENKSGVINQYYSIRKERKEAELNTMTLANRIALLKQEEIRTMKKIEDTRKKAMEIYNLKLKNEQKSQNKSVQAEKDITKKRDKVSELRASSIEFKRTNKEMHETMKIENVRRMKQAKVTYEKKIEQKKNEQILQARERNEAIKQQRENRQKKVLEFQKEKQDAIKRETLQKILEEDRIKEQKLQEMNRMEILELDFISRLQSTQLMQKRAYEELESALLLSSTDFYSRFLSKENQSQQQQQQSKDEVESLQNSKIQQNNKQQTPAKIINNSEYQKEDQQFSSSAQQVNPSQPELQVDKNQNIPSELKSDSDQNTRQQQESKSQ